MTGAAGSWTQNQAGPRHTASQDAAFVQAPVQGDCWWAAVADGVGSSPGGHEASTAAIAEVEGAARSGMVPGAADLSVLFRRCCRRLERLEAEEPQLRGLATTLTVLAACRDGLWIAHLGDCRAYRVGPQGASLLTRDDRVERGGAAYLTRALTAAGLHSPAVARAAPPAAGEWFLLCTDGVWSGGLDGVFGLQAREAVALLRRRAAGCRDDFCWVLVEVGVPSPDARRAATRPLLAEGAAGP